MMNQIVAAQFIYKLKVVFQAILKGKKPSRVEGVFEKKWAKSDFQFIALWAYFDMTIYIFLVISTLSFIYFHFFVLRSA